jgi:hypothetical protein
MRASAFVLIASIALPLTPAHATPLTYDFGGQNSHLYNRAQLTRFADDRGCHVVDLTRNHSPTYGDPLLKSANRGPLFPITRLELPPRHRVHDLLDRRGVASGLHLRHPGVLVKHYSALLQNDLACRSPRDFRCRRMASVREQE